MDRIPRRLGVILFGGGQSRRMGTCKLLLPWGSSGTVWDQALRVVQCMPGPVLAVVNTDFIGLEEAARRAGVAVARNDAAELGKSHSVRLALAQWETDGVLDTLDGVLCMCADQPFLTQCELQQVVAAFRAAYAQFSNRAIVCARYAGERGNPVVFGSHWFSALRMLTGDNGGRGILRGEGQSTLTFIDLAPRAGVDLDTPEAYEAWHRVWLAEQAAGSKKGDL